MLTGYGPHKTTHEADIPQVRKYKTATRAIEEYKLEGYKLVASSETGMLNELDRNLKRDKWSLINAWSPHWMFST